MKDKNQFVINRLKMTIGTQIIYIAELEVEIGILRAENSELKANAQSEIIKKE